MTESIPVPNYLLQQIERALENDIGLCVVYLTWYRKRTELAASHAR
jgi:hypothetical protein